MNEPYLALYVKDGMLHFAKKLPTETKPREILEVNIDEIIADELSDAAKKLGTIVFGILSLWHKDVFHGWGAPPSIEADEENESSLAHRLISESVSKKTRGHVQSIDLLLHQAARRSEDARKFLEDSWPVIRARLESFGP